jgi:hypothetical protein
VNIYTANFRPRGLYTVSLLGLIIELGHVDFTLVRLTTHILSLSICYMLASLAPERRMRNDSHLIASDIHQPQLLSGEKPHSLGRIRIF